MAKTYTDREVEEIFDRIWKWWPNKDKEAASRKALAVALRQGVDAAGIELACRIYSLEHSDDDYKFQLNNFILKDEWIDLLEGCKNPKEYYDKLQKEDDLARKIIEDWNNACKPHWIKVISIDDRVAIVKSSLKNEFFRTHWKNSLDKLVKIFNYRPRENDPRSKINLTLKWFCNVSPDKHTVLKIQEGEYGTGELETSETKYSVYKEVSEEEAKQVAEENAANFEEIFGRPLTRKKKDEQSVTEKGKGDGGVAKHIESFFDTFFD